jgi:hypothetical protein
MHDRPPTEWYTEIDANQVRQVIARNPQEEQNEKIRVLIVMITILFAWD